MIGDRIKELRKKNRYTQKEIGEMCGVSDISVYKWETDRTEPNIDTLCKLADIFGVSLDYLLGRTTDHEIKKEAPPAMAEGEAAKVRAPHVIGRGHISQAQALDAQAAIHRIPAFARGAADGADGAIAHPRAHGVWIVGAVHRSFPLSSPVFSHKKSPFTAQVKAAKGSKKARRMAGVACFTLPHRRWRRG